MNAADWGFNDAEPEEWSWMRTIVGNDLCRGGPVNHRKGVSGDREGDKREEGRGDGAGALGEKRGEESKESWGL